MPEFGEQIPIGGGRLEFIRDPQRGISTRISGTGETFRAIYQLAVRQDGEILGAVPVGGLRTAPPPPPPLTVFIQSDLQGMWGRRCPSCGSYFRTDHILGPTYCPYCSVVNDDMTFVTDAQKRYAKAFVDAALTAFHGTENVSIDLTNVTDATLEWQYSEEQQQFHFKCVDQSCYAETDILGEYGWCPRCGRSNARRVIETRLKANEEKLERTDREVTDRHLRGAEWELINNVAFSTFEPLGNHLRTRLMLFPATAKRRNDLANLSFQRIVSSVDALERWFDIDVLGDMEESERRFVNLMMQRRHIVTHNAGRVDQDYLDRSGDSSCRLNQRIRIRSAEAKRLLPLVRKMCANLLSGFEAIT
jgi:uncharacterized Zn finger protein (UPF0148 family)